MISYELAKKLADAGFPGGSGKYYPDGEEKEYILSPNLSELIEACGDKFIALARADFPGENGKLWAVVGNGFNAIGEIEGTTPEEAVANLWLALSTPKAPS